jgi:RNA polymerase sigma factor for flagellar operon FliA
MPNSTNKRGSGVKQGTQRETEASCAASATSPAVSHPYDAPAAGASPLTAEEREALILEHLPQVRLIARRIHERLPDSVNLDDLISTGAVGLISAIDRFDPSLKVKLRTYAEYKIRGAILDSLRGLDWAPRQQRKRHKQIEKAIAGAEQILHRTPSEEEIAAQLGITIVEYHEWLVETQGLNLGSLEITAPDEEGGRDLLSYISDDEEAWPSRIVERSELQKLLAEAIGKMPEMEKTVLSLYYYEELTLREISKIVLLHESRISQLKSQAILRLRAYMEKRWPCPRGI